MLAVLSPAKKLDFDSPSPFLKGKKPIFSQETKKLVDQLVKLNQDELGKLMSLSNSLSELNFRRYQDFSTTYSSKNSKSALFAFQGDTYVGFDAQSLQDKKYEYCESVLRILSGLYGILKPSDLIQPYRLEMGTKFSFTLDKTKYTNLYNYWSSKVTDTLNKELESGAHKYLVNLASNEYSKVIDQTKLVRPFLQIDFKEKKDGTYKSIGIFSKRARGMMARFIVDHKVTKLKQLKDFNDDGYMFNSKLTEEVGSSKNREVLVFSR